MNLKELHWDSSDFLCIFWTFTAFILAYVYLFPKTKYLYTLFKYFNQENIFYNIYEGASIYKRHTRYILKAFLLSLLVTAFSLSATYLLALAVGIRLSPVNFYLISVISSLVAVLPVSINGFGISDGVYVLFLGQLGIPAAAALSLSLTAHFIQYAIGLFGGVLFIFDQKDEKQSITFSG